MFNPVWLQVHKIACNHLITREMALQPLASSETAWCWFAMDYSEGCEDGSLEKLAVRSVRGGGWMGRVTLYVLLQDTMLIGLQHYNINH